jgi:transcriptional regulator with XRE-family HTH domain
MQDGIIERIKEIKRGNGLTNESFSERTKISIETIKSMFSKKTKPSLETIQKIISAFPLYSIEWLIMGRGEIQRENTHLFVYKNFFDFLTDSGRTYNTQQIAADFDMTAHKLNKKLEEMGVIRKDNDRWVLSDEYLGNGYQTPKIYIKKDDWSESKDYMVWTPKGRAFIYSLLSPEKISDVEPETSIQSMDNQILDRYEKLLRENERLTVENEQLQIELDKLGKKSNDALGA